MKQLVPLAVFAVFLTSSIAGAQTGTLEDRVKALEAKMDKGGGAATGTGVNAYFDDGLRFKTSDNTFAGRVGALAIFHYTNNATFDDADGYNDSFTTKQTGIEVEARLWEAFSGYVRPQFFGGASSLFLGWVQFDKWDFLKVRVGLFKEPYSQELLEDFRWQDMPENSLVSLTVPGRDLGAMIFGSPDGGIFHYWLGVFNGNGVAGDNNSDKDIAIRIQVKPGAKMESDIIKHLSFALHYTRGIAGRNSGAPFEFRAPASGTVFHFGPNVFESDEDRTRFGAELVWIWGPLSVKSEFSYLKSKHDMPDGSLDPFRVSSYMAEVGFWVLGSTRLNDKRPSIKKPLFKDGGFGDVQIVGRYSAIRLADTFEEEAGWVGSRSAKEVAFGLNYYPNDYVRVSVMYVYYRYDHEDTREFYTANGQVIDNESVFVFRAQIDF